MYTVCVGDFFNAYGANLLIFLGEFINVNMKCIAATADRHIPSLAVYMKVVSFGLFKLRSAAAFYAALITHKASHATAYTPHGLSRVLFAYSYALLTNTKTHCVNTGEVNILQRVSFIALSQVNRFSSIYDFLHRRVSRVCPGKVKILNAVGG